MSSDTSEKGLETIIMQFMTGEAGISLPPGRVAEHGPAGYAGAGYIAGSPQDYHRAHVLDLHQLFTFLADTQPTALGKLNLAEPFNPQDPNCLKFLTRLSTEIRTRGVIDVLRKGIEHHPAGHFDLFYGTPSPGNAKAEALHQLNRFSITRQLAYSNSQTRRALDLVLFINGLPLATFELKNRLTKQNFRDAIHQYQQDRDPREALFEFGRCAVHFAVDDQEVWMCTELKGKASWFLPFNKGFNDGAGNPPNPHGLKTAYLWEEVLTPAGLTNILENYAQIVVDKKAKTKRQIWPRYHQLEGVRRLLAHASAQGIGQRYLIQHSAGSGKSNSIAWLAHQLIGVKHQGRELFNSVIVVTDRRVLDDQIQSTIKQFMQVGSTVGHAERSGDLRQFIEQGKKIIISTVQKFPYILDEISAAGGKTFAIIIDEAHSSQGGKSSAAMSQALAENINLDEEIDPEDVINVALQERMSGRKLLSNASYFAFTATPKPKTLEMFGQALPPNAEGKIQHRPFHSYTMKQAIEEGFILDVLQNYIPVESYYRLVKKIEDDPTFDAKKAQKKLRRYVEGHSRAVELKTEIMVEHFHEQVIAAGKMKGEARAMVVTNGINQAIQYFYAFQTYLAERKSPYLPIVAFSGEVEYNGRKVTEAVVNGFPSQDIITNIQKDPYRFLICADKFQTGYDEPLLHTMYVDKGLGGIKAVQTLSRLNRAHPHKRDCFVLDFQNSSEVITHAFQDYYRTTILGEESDPNRLHDLKATLDNAQLYTPDEVDQLVALFLAGADRDKLDPILDRCSALYTQQLDEDEQIAFKGNAKAFCRTYDFLSTILFYNNAQWEKLSIFLNLLIPKLPAPQEKDLAKGILEVVDMDSYRVERKEVMKILLQDDEAVINPVPPGGGGRLELQIALLSEILKAFNEQHGTNLSEADRIMRRIQEDIAPEVAADRTYQNAKENTPHTARLAHDQALGRVMQKLLTQDTQVYKMFVTSESFQRFVSDMVYTLTQ